jgi:glycosyltransferase involved in cell wall biosynthesis
MGRLAPIAPETTAFVFLSFEGPDRYSMAGGLGTRITHLTQALARAGYETHLCFVGDPEAPGEEHREEGRLVLHRWCQWISRYYPLGVYQGEEGKRYDFTDMIPHYIAGTLMPHLLSAGKQVVIQGEEWQTAEALCAASDLLHWRGLRDRAFFAWNANNDNGFERVNWERLSYVGLLTTVSRYMKHRMWQEGVDPVVIGNGIPESMLEAPAPEAAEALRRAVHGDTLLFKVARFDPDKRWDMALGAVAEMRRRGRRPTLLMRGGAEPHGAEVLARAAQQGLRVSPVWRNGADGESTEAYLAAIAQADGADVIDLRFFLPDSLVRLGYRAADAVLANSGHEPFGLVGLEAMAAGGIAFTGATGEEYARHLENAVVLQTSDPREIVYYLEWLRAKPEVSAALRAEGRRTAERHTWPKVITQLVAALECGLSDRFPSSEAAP